MHETLLLLLTTALLGRTSSGNEAIPTNVTERIVKFRDTALCGKILNANIDCALQKTNEQPITEQTTASQLDEQQETTTSLCVNPENHTELCGNSEATSQNEVKDESSSTEAVASTTSVNDLQAEETFHTFSVALPPSEIIINVEKTARRASKPKINQALFSLNAAQRLAAIRAPPPTNKFPSTQFEVMKSIEIPFDSSQFQINNAAEGLPVPAHSDQVPVIYKRARLEPMENILQRRDCNEANGQNQRRHISGSSTWVNSNAKQCKLTDEENNKLSSQNQLPDYFDFNSRTLIGNNMVRQMNEKSIFGVKEPRLAEIPDEELKENHSEPYVNIEENSFSKSPTTSTVTEDIYNTLTSPKPPTRTHRRRNKNDIYNPSNTRNFYRSRFRKNQGNMESNTRDDIEYGQSIGSSTTTEVNTRSRPKEGQSRFRKPNIDFGTRNQSSPQVSSTVRTYPGRSQRRRTRTTTEMSPRSHSTTPSNKHAEEELSISPTRPSHVKTSQEANTESHDFQPQHQTLPPRTQLQNHHESSTQSTTPRPRGTRKYTEHEIFQTELPVSVHSTIQTSRKLNRNPELQSENQQRPYQQQVQAQHQQQKQQGQHQKQHRTRQQQWQHQELQQLEHRQNKQEKQRQQQEQQTENQQQQHQKQQQPEQQEWQLWQQQRQQLEQPEHQQQQKQQSWEQQWQQQERQRYHQQWIQPLSSKLRSGEHTLDVFTEVQAPEFGTHRDVFTNTQTKPGRTNRGQTQYHESLSNDQFLRVFHPTAGSTSFTHHGSIPTVDQRGQTQNILLVSYHHDTTAPPALVKPVYQRHGPSFFF
ncbi:putative uncharacterized protein DDB_G0271606 [Bacillus rossius redtenbacheri]|uniref:putative uncharacterized protein DDB_G0271606 n=1 Tax=Bacillus rossius redtenbacheri TaxID=93214 RepID=UPI002FDD1853